MRSRRRILTATAEIILSQGFPAATIAAVAGAAGVSRQTVYSIFGTREQLMSDAIAALVIDLSTEIASTADVAGRPGTRPSADIAAIVIAARSVLHEREIAGVLSTSSSSNPVLDPGVVPRARPIAGLLLSPVLEKHPALADRWDDIVDYCIVLGLHVVLFTEPSVTDDEVAAFIVRWVAPALDTRATRD